MRVVKPGMLTTFQDLGRRGLTSQGFTESGALDAAAYRRACLLTGQQPGLPALEFFYMGPTLCFSQEADACVTGAPFRVTVDGKCVGTERLFHVPAGATVTIGPCAKGTVGYLQVAGDGFSIEPVAGSFATTTAYRVGGFEGRALQAGDVVPLGKSTCAAKHGLGFAPRAAAYGFDDEAVTLRVIPGPHAPRFDEDSLRAFFSTPYKVTPKSNRMGARLEGRALQAAEGTDITSEGVVAGTIQVNGEGQPMIMLADHQTTGGYAIIGVVISDDLPRIAQAAPGRMVRFQETTVAAAQQILRRNATWEKSILETIEERILRAEQKGAPSC